MDDFTRIPTILTALEDVWLGQPDLNFGALIGMLGNFGVDWTTTDERALTLLHDIATRFPGTVSRQDGRATGLFEVIADSGARRLFLDPNRVLVLPGKQRAKKSKAVHARPRMLGSPPSMWAYSHIRQAQVGMPLLVADPEGFVHRLGVVERIIPRHVPTPSRESTSGLVVDAFYHVRRGDDDDLKLLCLDGHVCAWVVGRRETRSYSISPGEVAFNEEGLIARVALSDAKAGQHKNPKQDHSRAGRIFDVVKGGDSNSSAVRRQGTGDRSVSAGVNPASGGNGEDGASQRVDLMVLGSEEE